MGKSFLVCEKSSPIQAVYFLTVSVEAYEVATDYFIFVKDVTRPSSSSNCSTKGASPVHLISLPEWSLVDGLCPLIRREIERQAGTEKEARNCAFYLTRDKKITF